MLLRMPNYCRDFKCSASKCSDNCCIGWEIDIDEKTAEYYKNLDGDFGNRLKSGITFSSPSSFILKNERCPFLNDRNLCDIILTLGEDKLCHICNEHPRYYEWFSGIKEGGVGMCCEEGARLILKRGNETDYYEREVPNEPWDEYDYELYNLLLSVRENIIGLLKNKDIPLFSAVSSILRYGEEIQFRIDNFDFKKNNKIPVQAEKNTDKPDVKAIFKIFEELEPIDGAWIPFIQRIEKSAPLFIDRKYEQYLRNIGIYFIWRYLMKGIFDEEILSKVKLAVISMAVLGLIFTAENSDFESSIILAKNFSKELEYSEENLEKIYDLTYSESVFSAKELERFFG